ncbi:hypothetical protein CDL12_29534 [Handroanthus impetiginosus]|uniref:Uncharacterized protein n=1 Tax=Handroanthus impetiginosus TaxID=429701 RepID=A0A2G9FY50_9LAMI|nr:hypothetical protein CDL12_29534 [Handroanthus impetiginosus]
MDTKTTQLSQRRWQKREDVLLESTSSALITTVRLSIVSSPKQRDNEPLREFMKTFNKESLMVQDLTMDLKVLILLNSLRPGNFRSKLSRSPPKTIKELRIMAEKYTNEEEFVRMKEQGMTSKTFGTQKEKKDHKGTSVGGSSLLGRPSADGSSPAKGPSTGGSSPRGGSLAGGFLPRGGLLAGGSSPPGGPPSGGPSTGGSSPPRGPSTGGSSPLEGPSAGGSLPPGGPSTGGSSPPGGPPSGGPFL